MGSYLCNKRDNVTTYRAYINVIFKRCCCCKIMTDRWIYSINCN